MKLLIVPPLLLLAFLSTPSSAASEQLFQQLDKDQDGWLVVGEIDAKHRRLFDRLLRTSDSDQDGRLSGSEFQSSLTAKQKEKPLTKKQGSEIPGADALLLMLAKMDDNADGRIEEHEVPEQFVELFRQIEDRLGGEPDGTLDRRELTQAAPGLARMAQRMAQQMDLDLELELALLSEKQWQSVQSMLGGRGSGNPLANTERALAFFRQLDSNGDGKVTFAELPKQIADRIGPFFDRLDRNSDEQITKQELLKLSRQMQTMAANKPSPKDISKGVKRIIKQLDRNGDKLISRDEAPRQMQQRFDRIDRDGNGQLDREELTPIVETLGRLRRPEGKSTSGSEMMQESE